MKTTIDAAGRLVIPKKIREEAGLTPGTPVEVRVRDGVIEIEPETLSVKLVRKGHLLVAAPLRDVPPLPADIVDQMRDALIRERADID